MSRRSPPLLVEDIWEAVEKIERYVSGMDHDAFVGDEKTIDSVVRNLEIIGEAATACRKISGCSSQKSNGLKLLDSDIASSTIISISTLRSSGRLSRPIWQFSNPEFRQPANLEKKKN